MKGNYNPFHSTLIIFIFRIFRGINETALKYIVARKNDSKGGFIYEEKMIVFRQINFLF